mmetsp:Transcript_129145/g.224142  ORF Transcript_129145/g.224142 Transcript_129145/m.224142 type:complete len:260 (-) Transcript_129145:66-845(-)
MLCRLRWMDPQIVIANRVEDSPKLCPQQSQASSQRLQSISNVPRHNEHVFPEHHLVNVAHPILITLVVEVYVRNCKDPRRALRARHIASESRSEACSCIRGLPEWQYSKTSIAASSQQLILRIHLQPNRKLTVCLLVQSRPQQSCTQTVASLHKQAGHGHSLPGVANRGFPVAEFCESQGPVCVKGGQQYVVPVADSLGHLCNRDCIAGDCSSGLTRLQRFVAFFLYLMGRVCIRSGHPPRYSMQCIHVCRQRVVLHCI